MSDRQAQREELEAMAAIYDSRVFIANEALGLFSCPSATDIRRWIDSCADGPTVGRHHAPIQRERRSCCPTHRFALARHHADIQPARRLPVSNSADLPAVVSLAQSVTGLISFFVCIDIKLSTLCRQLDMLWSEQVGDGVLFRWHAFLQVWSRSHFACIERCLGRIV